MKKNKKTLNRAEDIMLLYHDDESIYFKELIKSYNEYVNLENIDKTTNELYIKHIDGLCNMIEEKKNSKVTITILIVILFLMFCLCTYSTYNYYLMSKNISGILYKSDATLTVNYGNLENFNALTSANIVDYKELTPLTLSLSSNSRTHESMKYNIYLIEENDDVDEYSLLSRDAFVYNVKSSTRDSGIKYLKDASIKDDKILIYSSSFESTENDDVEIRMWIDDSYENYEFKIYRFKIYVEGYI